MQKIKLFLAAWLILNIFPMIFFFLDLKSLHLHVNLGGIFWVLSGAGWIESWISGFIHNFSGFILQIPLLLGGCAYWKARPNISRSIVLVFVGLFSGPLGVAFMGALGLAIAAFALVWLLCASIFGKKHHWPATLPKNGYSHLYHSK